MFFFVESNTYDVGTLKVGPGQTSQSSIASGEMVIL